MRPCGGRGVGNTLTTVIPTAKISTASNTVVEVTRAPGLMERRAELDGFAGAQSRLRSAYDAIYTGGGISPPDLLIKAMQAGDRLSYHPENAGSELRVFGEELTAAQQSVVALRESVRGQAQKEASSTTSEAHQRRLAAVARAEALIEDAHSGLK